MRAKPSLFTFVSIISFSIIGCNGFNNKSSNISKYTYHHDEYSGEQTASYREYFSFNTGELIRLFENNIFEYVFLDLHLVSSINYSNSYFSLNVEKDSDSYYHQDGKEYRDINRSVYLFKYNDDKITFLPNYSFSNDIFLQDTEYLFVYEGNNNPPYHYKKEDSDYFEFCYFLKHDYEDKESAVNALCINQYLQNVSSFISSNDIFYNCSLLFLKLPSTNFIRTIDTLNKVDNNLLYHHPVYYLHSTGGEYLLVNVAFYDLKPTDQINEVSYLGAITGNGYESKLFSSYSSFGEYVAEINGDANVYSPKDTSISQFYNSLDKSLFEGNNLILTESLMSPVTSECTFYNSCYLKDGVLSVVFDSTPYAGGYTSLSYRAYFIAIPKAYYIEKISILV